MGDVRNTYEVGSSDQRPWGTWRVIDAGNGFVVKRIEVNPAAKLSLQLHQGRDEHWVIVNGEAEVTRGSEVLHRSENESIFITKGTAHRIANVGASPLVFIEVQVGALLDEADIVRLEDVYGRS